MASPPGTTCGIAPQVRAFCLGLPATTEKVSHGGLGFFVGRQFAQMWTDGHHDRTGPHLWCAAPAGAQEGLVATSDHYFRPPYVGHRGWIGIRLDGPVDWDDLADHLTDAYRLVAAPRLVAGLAARRPAGAPAVGGPAGTAEGTRAGDAAPSGAAPPAPVRRGAPRGAPRP